MAQASVRTNHCRARRRFPPQDAPLRADREDGFKAHSNAQGCQALQASGRSMPQPGGGVQPQVWTHLRLRVAGRVSAVARFLFKIIFWVTRLRNPGVNHGVRVLGSSGSGCVQSYWGVPSTSDFCLDFQACYHLTPSVGRGSRLCAPKCINIAPAQGPLAYTLASDLFHLPTRWVGLPVRTEDPSLTIRYLKRMQYT